MEEFNAEGIISMVFDFCKLHQIPLALSSIASDGGLASHVEHSTDLVSFLSFGLAIKPIFMSIALEKISRKGISTSQT